MRLLCGILAVFTILILSNQALAADKKDTKKLQIGVKKRVANCQTRSKSGDTLHMHYTVSETIWRSMNLVTLLNTVTARSVVSIYV